MDGVEQFFKTRKGWLFSLSAAEDSGSLWDGDAIVWTHEREEAFIACGLIEGPVRAFYPIPPKAWGRFLTDAAELVYEYTGEHPDF